MNAPLVSVVMVSWNGRSWLETALPPLIAQDYPNYEIIVVDNGSEDDTVNWIKRQYPTIQLIALDENQGFAAANNIGIHQSSAPFIATLNNDTKVEPDWLSALMAAVDAPDVGMVASAILRWQAPHLLDSAGIEIDWSGTAWNRGWEQPAAAAQEAVDVFGPSAAAALYRRTMLEKIGLFDEGFFAYYEDVDLAWRAQLSGWRCRYTPTARVVHWHSATGNRLNKHKAYYLSRNKIWAIAKNYQRPRLFWIWPALLVRDVGSLIYQTIQSRSMAGWRGRWDALRGLKRMLPKE